MKKGRAGTTETRLAGENHSSDGRWMRHCRDHADDWQGQDGDLLIQTRPISQYHRSKVNARRVETRNSVFHSVQVIQLRGCLLT